MRRLKRTWAKRLNRHLQSKNIAQIHQPRSEKISHLSQIFSPRSSNAANFHSANLAIGSLDTATVSRTCSRWQRLRWALAWPTTTLCQPHWTITTQSLASQRTMDTSPRVTTRCTMTMNRATARPLLPSTGPKWDKFRTLTLTMKRKESIEDRAIPKWRNMHIQLEERDVMFTFAEKQGKY